MLGVSNGLDLSGTNRPASQVYPYKNTTYSASVAPPSQPSNQTIDQINFSGDGKYACVTVTGQGGSTAAYMYSIADDGTITFMSALTGILSTVTGSGATLSADGTYIAISTVGSPFVNIYKRTGSTFARLANPASLPANTTNDWAFSSDATYLACATAGKVEVYKRAGDTFTKITTPALSSGNATGVSFSKDDTYLAIGTTTTPFIVIYKRSGDTFTKLADPATLPTTQTNSPAFSPDGTYLACVHGASPGLLIYKRSGDTFTKLPDPAGVPTTTATILAYMSFSADGNYLAYPNDPVYSGVVARAPLVYSRSGDTFTRITGIPTAGTYNSFNNASFSPPGVPGSR